MRYVIIEDEAPAQAQLQADMADLLDDAELVGSYGTVREALVGLPRCRDLDVVLCDVQLADGSCFEIFDRVAVRCPVIFCTAYDRYVMEALSTQGVDYLLKPVEKTRLAQALAKVQSLESHFRDLAQGRGIVVSGAVRPRRLLTKQGAVTIAVDHDQISHLVSEDKVVVVVARDGTRSIVDGSLAEVAERLPSAAFLRANRRYILHVSCVQGFRSAGHGRLAVTVEGVSNPVMVSQDNARRFRTWLEGS